MDLKKVALFFVLADFTAYSLWVAANGGGVSEVFGLFAVNPWIGQVTLDLVIALSFVSVWIWRDATAHGRNPLPWIIATVFTGSIAPLTYFVFRPSDASEPLAHREPGAVAHHA
jgi:hypothetical protein